LANRTRIKDVVQRPVNLSKITLWAVIINACQILAVSALSAYSLSNTDLHLSGWLARLLIITASLMVVWGAVLDIREALAARKNASQRQILMEAYANLEELNATLRAQRHDFRNHIQVIYTLTELDDRQAALDYMDKVYADIQKVGRALRTASPAVNALLAAKLADCEENDIEFTSDIRTDWADCPVPDWEMCRILGNLIDNAIEALSDAPEKRITVSLWEDVRSWHFAVENTGVRIPEAIRATIFVPGFSTKGEGRGTGLHIVRSIIADHGGTIDAESTDSLTRFTGMIPRNHRIKPA